MTSTAARAPVTVAVSGDERAALVFAVTEARRLDRPLRLVHAVEPIPIPETPMGPLVGYQDLDQAAHQILNRAGDMIRSLSDEIVVLEKVVRHGPAAQVLVQESESSEIVVLEHRAMSRLARVLAGSISTAVAARAHCRVVSVPEGWAPHDEHRGVVAGVDESGGPAEAVHTALEEARRRQAPLSVLHAWRLARQYDDIGDITGVRAEWREHAEPLVAGAVARCTRERPEVPATVALRYAEPADALVEAAKEADLLVLGRRTRRGRLHIGSLARTMIRVADCPVMVVPVAHSHEAQSHDTHEAADSSLSDEVSPQA